MNGIQMPSKNVNFPSSATSAAEAPAAPALCDKAVDRASRWELKIAAILNFEVVAKIVEHK